MILKEIFYCNYLIIKMKIISRKDDAVFLINIDSNITCDTFGDFFILKIDKLVLSLVWIIVCWSFIWINQMFNYLQYNQSFPHDPFPLNISKSIASTVYLFTISYSLMTPSLVVLSKDFKHALIIPKLNKKIIWVIIDQAHSYNI